MNDMTAFERQLSGEIAGLMGPVRPVDDAAILASLTATRSPQWRVQSMFSATRSVVAAAVVALFGGFLLAGVLTQPSDDTLPAVGASAYPTARVEPTLGATSEPEPAPTDADAEQADSTPRAGLPGSFSPTGSMEKIRSGHTATRLLDGRILIVGGFGSEDSQGSAEIWDPATGSFTPAGTLVQPRYHDGGHTATLLPDGRVLVVGGFDQDAFGLRSAEVWDPDTASFSPAGRLAEGHAEHTATLLPDGRVLIIGGYRRFQHFAEAAEVWDPETETFAPADLMAAPRFNHTATLLPDGRVLIVGGEGTGDRAQIADPPSEVWDPVTGSSSPAGSLAEGRFQHTATLLRDGRVLVVGGESHSDTIYAPTSVAEIWDPETESFDPAGTPLVQARRGHTATLLSDGRVLIIGGDSGYETNDTDNYTVHASAELWDPETASFSPAGILAEARAYHTATLLPDGRVLVVGGGVDGGPWSASAEIWSPGDRSSVTNETVRTPSALTTTPPIELPAEIPEGIESGTLETPLGPARWVHVTGDETTLPNALDPIRVPTGGYLTLDHEASSRLWRSPDLITWASEALPMAVEAFDRELALVDDTVWLTAAALYEPAAMWRSVDSLAWTEMSLEDLAPPAPAGSWLLDLDTPLAFDGVTIVPFRHLADPALVDKALGGTGRRDAPWCCRRDRDTGAYVLTTGLGEPRHRVRFEEADEGLRVIDVDDGTELTFLEGVSLGFIELLASSDGQASVLGLAVLEPDGLVPIGLPDAIREHPETAFGIDDEGFVVHGLGRDGLVHVHRSEDGRSWTETDVVGDDPGEPPDIEHLRPWQGSVVIESRPLTAREGVNTPNPTLWMRSNDGAWRAHPGPEGWPPGFPFADGYFWVPWDEVEMGVLGRDALWYRADGGQPTPIDPGDDLGMVAQLQRDLASLSQGEPSWFLFSPLGPSTVAMSYSVDGSRHLSRHLWIITFDELSG